MADKVMGTNSAVQVKAEGRDAAGSPAPLVDCSWTVGDANLLSITPDAADPTLATVQSAGGLGSTVVQAVGHGVDGATLQDQKSVQVAAPAVALVITFL